MEKIAGDFQNPDKHSNKNSDDEEWFATLPRVKYWNGIMDLYEYRGFWYPCHYFRGCISFQRHFQAKDEDIILATFPKCGTTWLKALTYTIVNRNNHQLENSPLLATNPHDLVRFIDVDIYHKSPSPNFEDFSSPRMFCTHTPFSSLPYSIVNSNCRVVYLCRNPFDQFISLWKFIPNMEEYKRESEITLEKAFDKFCDGVVPFGPFWKHVLEYWKASIEQPHKILFLKYEDLQEDIVSHVKKLAEFFRLPFSKNEEINGMGEKISKFCSFDKMKDLEVNKSGQTLMNINRKSFFRKGKVGDWKSYFTPSMAERLEKVIKKNLDGSGLSFRSSI